MILLFDNYDSFTFNLLDLLQKINLEVKVVRNDEYTLEEIIKFKPRAIVISPGPGRPSTSGILMPLIEYYHNRVPIFGVCLGMQAIGEFFGAELVRAQQAIHGKTSEILHTNHLMFSDVPQKTQMMRYHSLILQNIMCLYFYQY